MDGYAATWRLYHYDQGLWVSPDPAGLGAVDPTNPQSWNRYAYALNNPLSGVDTNGMGGNCTYYSGVDSQGELWIVAYCSAYTGTIVINVTANGQNSGGSPGSGGGGSETKRRINCAARFGDNHRIAAAFGAQNTFIGQFLGGNTASGLADLYLNVVGYSTPSAGDLAQVALGGAGQGIPPLSGESGVQTLFSQGAQIGSHSAGWDGAAGIAVDHIVSSGTSLAAKLLPGRVVGIVGKLGLEAVNVAAWGQLALDVSTFGYGLYKCW